VFKNASRSKRTGNDDLGVGDGTEQVDVVLNERSQVRVLHCYDQYYMHTAASRTVPYIKKVNQEKCLDVVRDARPSSSTLRASPHRKRTTPPPTMLDRTANSTAPTPGVRREKAAEEVEVVMPMATPPAEVST
jgi:hypothetical protein